MAQSEDSLHKLPPQDLDAERAVLGAALLENDALFRVVDVIGADDFYRDAHRKIFNAMLQLNERNEPIDLITLTDLLRREGALEAVGGASYISGLVDAIPTAANIRMHGKIVREKALLRNMIGTATEIVTRAYDQSDRVENLLDEAERSIFAISEQNIRPAFIPIKDVVKGSFEMIEKLYERKERVTGAPMGIAKLDEMTSGLQPSDLIIIAGRPSMGKTALALGVAQHIGINKGGTVAIFSLEMSKEQLVLRMLCSEARVDSHKLRSGFLAKTDWPKLTTAAGRLAESPIFIDDSAALSVLETRAKARRLKAERGLSLIIVDYLQLMRGRGEADTREQEISTISRGLKALAKELSVPVVALSQLSRAVESRAAEHKKPILADLRESGAIEQDADVVMFIYREEVYRRTDDNHGVAEIIIGKQRNGPTGSVKVTFLERYTRFENLERDHAESEAM